MIILLERIGDQWARGEVEGRVGIFPLDFVEVIEDLPGMIIIRGVYCKRHVF